jgi:hypothetical protein
VIEIVIVAVDEIVMVIVAGRGSRSLPSWVGIGPRPRPRWVG